MTRTSFIRLTIQLPNVLNRCQTVSHVPVKISVLHVKLGTSYKIISVSNVHKLSIVVLNVPTVQNAKFVMMISCLMMFQETAHVKLVGMCQMHAQQFMAA